MTFPRTSLCLCLAVTLAQAQQTGVYQNAPVPQVGISEWISIVSIPAVPNAPFSATTMMDNSHTLEDGTVVTTKTMTTIARDSKGSTHNENRYSLRPSDNGVGRIRDITIYDPETRTRTTLTPANQEVTAFTLPPPMPRNPTGSQTVVRPPEPEREDLGISVIEGVSVHGYRSSRTIPEGVEGNDRPITITDDYWHSDELDMNISVKHSDPRHGTQVVVLTQLSREEPDPKMFEVPPNYRVHDNGMGAATRISRDVAAANLISSVEPQYPSLALAARIQGTVEFNAVIGDDGVIQNLQLVRGHPLLVNAAKEAVLQYRYRPTLLNGSAVSVVAPVIVKFTPP